MDFRFSLFLFLFNIIFGTRTQKQSTACNDKKKQFYNKDKIKYLKCIFIDINRGSSGQKQVNVCNSFCNTPYIFSKELCCLTEKHFNICHFETHGFNENPK